jgi:RecB family exonuclease
VRPRELGAWQEQPSRGPSCKLLQRTYADLRGELRRSHRQRCLTRDALERAFAALQLEEPPANSVAEKAARATARTWAARVLGDDACRYEGFAPAHLEWSFGSATEPVDAGGFHLTGRVDRIDIDVNGRAIVIDYKRTVVPSAAHIVEHGKVQMPLCFMAARTRLEIEPIAGIYRRLSKRDDRGLVLRDSLPNDAFVRTDLKDGDEFTAVVDAGVELARQAVAGIRAGRIPCEPRKRTSCTNCTAALFCGSAR